MNTQLDVTQPQEPKLGLRWFEHKHCRSHVDYDEDHFLIIQQSEFIWTWNTWWQWRQEMEMSGTSFQRLLVLAFLACRLRLVQLSCCIRKTWHLRIKRAATNTVHAGFFPGIWIDSNYYYYLFALEIYRRNAWSRMTASCPWNVSSVHCVNVCFPVAHLGKVFLEDVCLAGE